MDTLINIRIAGQLPNWESVRDRVHDSIPPPRGGRAPVSLVDVDEIDCRTLRVNENV